MTAENSKPVTVASPDPELTVSIDGKDVKLFMSFGLLDELLKQFSDEHPVEDMAHNPTQRSQILQIVLAPQDEYGLPGGFDPKKTRIDTQNVTKIFEWVLDHVTDFFIQQAEAAIRISKKYAARTSSLTPSETGSTV